MDEQTRDTYKYHMKNGGETVTRGITYDLRRREAQHQKEFPGSHIKQVGRITTHEAAREWLSRGRDRHYTAGWKADDESNWLSRVWARVKG